MEQWQREYITKNKDKLIKTTLCDARLLACLESCDVLSHSDTDSLKAVGHKGALNQSSMLYEIIQTRIRGYEKLTKSIFECLQTGALKILLDGFEKNEIRNPFEVCHINLDVNKFLQLGANFMSKVCTINDICGQLPEAKIQNILQSTLNGSLYFELFHSEERQPKLNILKNNIPEPLDFYVPRSLSAKLVLNPKVFREKCEDVFVFTNIERYQLTLLVKPNQTGTSEDMNSIQDIRFILLCSDEDLDAIRNPFANSTIHLIKYRTTSNQYILEQTWGNAHFIRKFMSSEITVTENKFIKLSQDKGYNGICICDTPGMGKSVLLANLARNIASNNHKICIFISLAKLIGDDLDGHISSSPIEENILSEILTLENIQVELFFDGFDEVPSSSVSAGRHIVEKSLTDISNSRIYVTSRPHMQQVLENTFGVIGYNILPFDKTNQINFLVDHWKREIKNSDDSKLYIFAHECLNTLEKNISSTERDFAGVPIQCRILAEVLKNDAKLSLRNSSRSDVSRILSSIFDMYSEFMKMRFAKEPTFELRNDLKAYHVIFAIDLIFPQMTNCCKSLLYVSTFLIVDTVPLLNIGILEGQQNENSKNLQFVHRTFAEFLIAQFFADILSNNKNYEKIDPISYSTVINFFYTTFLTATKNEKRNQDWDNFSFTSYGTGYWDTKSKNISVLYPTINYFLNGDAKC